MAEENSTMKIKEFVFVAFTNKPALKTTLFLLFLTFYLATLVGNLGMIALIRASPQLHTPMYFFLSNLSLIDTIFSSVVACKCLANLLADKKSISFIGCVTQMHFVIGLASAEGFLLAAMAYDRYVAICKPLQYPVLMSPRVYIFLMIGSYVLGFLHSLIHTIFIFRLSFCGPNVINHVYCDISTLLLISCSDTHTNELLIFYVAGLVEGTTMLGVFFSYIYILANIVKSKSASARVKAFSTCSSHLTAVIIFHGSILILHFRPKPSGASPIQEVTDKILGVFYTIIIPLLNPLIYSLRNKEVKNAFAGVQRKIWDKTVK